MKEDTCRKISQISALVGVTGCILMILVMIWLTPMSLIGMQICATMIVLGFSICGIFAMIGMDKAE